MAPQLHKLAASTKRNTQLFYVKGHCLRLYIFWQLKWIHTTIAIHKSSYLSSNFFHLRATNPSSPLLNTLVAKCREPERELSQFPIISALVFRCAYGSLLSKAPCATRRTKPAAPKRAIKTSLLSLVSSSSTSSSAAFST